MAIFIQKYYDRVCVREREREGREINKNRFSKKYFEREERERDRNRGRGEAEN